MQQHFFSGLLFILSIIKFIRLYYKSLVLKNHHAPEEQCCSAFCLIPHMERYSHMDHARDNCVTACPNLVTESQNMQNHIMSEEKSHKKSPTL